MANIMFIQTPLQVYAGANILFIQLCRIQNVEKGHTKKSSLCRLLRDPAGTRTQGPYIKSVLLYQLSYEIDLLLLPAPVFETECKNKGCLLSHQKNFRLFSTNNPANHFAIKANKLVCELAYLTL
jgi:hypothetical protein